MLGEKGFPCTTRQMLPPGSTVKLCEEKLKVKNATV